MLFHHGKWWDNILDNIFFPSFFFHPSFFKMAPVYAACRLLLLVPLVFVLFLSTICKNVDSLLVYDRQTLLNIRSATNDLVNYDRSEQRTSLPFASTIPFYLWRAPVPLFWRRRYRRRGKCRGLLVKIKRHLVNCLSGESGESLYHTCWKQTGSTSHYFLAFYGFCIHWADNARQQGHGCPPSPLTPSPERWCESPKPSAAGSGTPDGRRPDSDQDSTGKC